MPKTKIAMNTLILLLCVVNGTARGLQYETAKLMASDAAKFDRFGFSIAVVDKLIVVGAPGWVDATNPGSASLFQTINNGTTWIDVQTLTTTDAPGGDDFGASTAVGGNLVVVGAPSDDDRGEDSGAVYVFKSLDDGWIETQKLTASDAAEGDYFGNSVAIADNLVVVGAPYAHRMDDGRETSGLVYVFRSLDDGSTWNEVQKLTASDPADWRYGDKFGYSVAIAGHLIVVGTPQGASFDDEDPGDSGSAYVYRSLDDGMKWTEAQKLNASDAAEGDLFG